MCLRDATQRRMMLTQHLQNFDIRKLNLRILLMVNQFHLCVYFHPQILVSSLPG